MISMKLLFASAICAVPLAALSQVTAPNTTTGTNASTQTNVTPPNGTPGSANGTTTASGGVDTQSTTKKPKRPVKATPATEPASDPASPTTRSPSTPTTKNDGATKP